MGDIADGMLDGTFDSLSGEYLGEGPGYPRTIHEDNSDFSERQKVSGIKNFIKKKAPGIDPENVVKEYVEKCLKAEKLTTFETSCVTIQENFPKFSKWFNQNYLQKARRNHRRGKRPRIKRTK